MSCIMASVKDSKMTTTTTMRRHEENSSNNKNNASLFWGRKNVFRIMAFLVMGFCLGSMRRDYACLQSSITASAMMMTATTTKNAATGVLLEGTKTRTYTGELKCSRHQMKKKTRNGISIFNDTPVSSSNCSLWAVVTTINEPTESIQQVAKLTLRKNRAPDAASDDECWCMVIVGDTDTPDDMYRTLYHSNNNNIIYLSVDDQKQISHPFDQAIPYRSFARKNIGYLYAIAHGAKAIFDFDDDNLLKTAPQTEKNDPLVPFSLTGNRENILFRYLPNHQIEEDTPPAFNPYELMNPSQSNTWPRGFPLDQIQNPLLTDNNTDDDQVAFGSLPLSSIGVIQSVCDGDPDVDAVYRLTRPMPVTFDDSRESSKLLVPAKLFAPYNAQATVHTHVAFWGLLLPSTVTGRVSDIWRSYFTQRIMHDLNLGVLYAPPMVTHKRNEHSYMADLQAEQDLYHKTSPLLNFLSNWKDDDADAYLPARIEKLYIALYEREYIGLEDVVAIQQWLLALQNVGYNFPVLPPNNNESDPLGVTKQPSMHRQPLLARPYYNVNDEGLTYQEFLTKDNLTNSTEAIWNQWITQTPPMAVSNNTNSRRPDQLIVKLVMMTKDEWPLLKHWMLYHGELLGFENLYIIDDSTDPHCTAFLRHARDHLGANVIFSPANLNQLTGEMTQIGVYIQGSSDLTLKMDTDEFFVVNEGHAPCVQIRQTLLNCTLTPYAVADFLRDMDSWESLAKGQPLKAGYVSVSHPDRDLCEKGRGNDIAHFPFGTPGPAIFKAVVDSRSLKGYDLGGHHGVFHEPMASKRPDKTRIGVLHTHHRCYEHEVENSHKAVVSHGYISPNATDDEALKVLVDRFVGPQGACSIYKLYEMKKRPASYHKILAYAKLLECPEKYKEEYYNNPGDIPFHPKTPGDPQINEGFARFMGHVLRKYDATSANTPTDASL